MHQQNSELFGGSSSEPFWMRSCWLCACPWSVSLLPHGSTLIQSSQVPENPVAAPFLHFGTLHILQYTLYNAHRHKPLFTEW